MTANEGTTTPRTRSTTTAVALLGVLLTGCASPSEMNHDTAGNHSSTAGHLRLERSLQLATPWTVDCDGDSCGGVELIEITFHTPASVAAVDLTVNVTLNIQVNDDQSDGPPADYAMIGANLGQDCTGRFHDLNPGPLPLRVPAANNPSTTSVTWTKGRIAAAGRSYCIHIAISPRDGDGDAMMSISGSKFAAVAETWPTGP